MYAIQHKDNHMFITGTDFSQRDGSGFRQFLCSHPMKTYEKKSEAVEDFKKRKCGKQYKVVKLD